MNLKDEAFGLWLEQWGKLYSEDSTSYQILKDIADNYYLINLVDNDYVQESCLFDLLESMFEQRRNPGVVKSASTSIQQG